jgi:hypothetical protein
LRFGDLDYVITLGYFEDGTRAEVFVDGSKAGSDIQATSRDAAIVITLALQFGCSIELLRNPSRVTAIARRNRSSAPHTQSDVHDDALAFLGYRKDLKTAQYYDPAKATSKVNTSATSPSTGIAMNACFSLLARRGSVMLCRTYQTANFAARCRDIPRTKDQRSFSTVGTANQANSNAWPRFSTHLGCR